MELGPVGPAASPSYIGSPMVGTPTGLFLIPAAVTVESGQVRRHG